MSEIIDKREYVGVKVKKFFQVFMAAVIVLSMTACGGSGTKSETSGAETNAAVKESNVSEDGTTVQTEASAEPVKSDGYEKFSQIEMGMTEAEVNAILGEPVKIDKAYYTYNIQVNGQDMEITVWINTVSGVVINKYGSFWEDEYRAEFADSETDLSAAGDLDTGELATYEQCVEAFKTPGYLTSLDEDGVKQYLWVDANDGHIAITFKADGSVKSYVGYC